MSQKERLVIWWIPTPNETLLQKRADEVEALPDYISREVEDLYGRSLRGRLWVAPEFKSGFHDLEWNADSSLAERASESGGAGDSVLASARSRANPSRGWADSGRSSSAD